MAKKTEQDLVRQESALPVSQESALPAYMRRGDTRGVEHIAREDMQIPRLKIAQPQSPQVLKGDPQFIDDLKVGESFNDLTGEIYGDGPLEVVFVRADPPRHVLFDPNDRKKILEFSLPVTDPRTQWTVDEKGKRQQPEATKFYDFVVLLGEFHEPMALSFSSTGIKVAMKINGLICLRDKKIAGGEPVPIFGKRYELLPVFNKNEKGTWYLFSARQLGLVGEETYKLAEAAFEMFADKAIEFDRSTSEAQPEGDAAAGDM